MANVLIRDVPADVHARLQQRAAARGQSLQQFLSAEMSRLATELTMAEVLDRIAGRHGGRVGLEQAVGDIEAGRGRR